jgi:transposase
VTPASTRTAVDDQASVADFGAAGKETAMDAETFVGIDVSKDWLDVVVRPDGEHRRLANDADGWAEAVTWLGAERALVVLEASGGYERGMARALAAAGIAVSVGNPLWLRRWMQSQGQRAKTDRLDAALLAHYAEERCPVPTVLPDETARTVAALERRRRQLSQMKAAEQTRRTHPDLPADIGQQIAEHLAWLAAQVKQVDRQLAAVVATDALWQEQVAQVDSVPGFALLSATRLLVGLPELGKVSAEAAAALAGVAPYEQESGHHRGRRVIGGGRRWVRHALYEALTTTIRCDPTFAAHYAQLRAKGKPHKVAMVACMRRMLGILTVMRRDGLTWQQTAVGQGKFLPAAA